MSAAPFAVFHAILGSKGEEVRIALRMMMGKMTSGSPKDTNRAPVRASRERQAPSEFGVGPWFLRRLLHSEAGTDHHNGAARYPRRAPAQGG